MLVAGEYSGTGEVSAAQTWGGSVAGVSAARGDDGERGGKESVRLRVLGGVRSGDESGNGGVGCL